MADLDLTPAIEAALDAYIAVGAEIESLDPSEVRAAFAEDHETTEALRTGLRAALAAALPALRAALAEQVAITLCPNVPVKVHDPDCVSLSVGTPCDCRVRQVAVVAERIVRGGAS